MFAVLHAVHAVQLRDLVCLALIVLPRDCFGLILCMMCDSFDESPRFTFFLAVAVILFSTCLVFHVSI